MGLFGQLTDSVVEPGVEIFGTAGAYVEGVLGVGSVRSLCRLLVQLFVPALQLPRFLLEQPPETSIELACDFLGIC